MSAILSNVGSLVTSAISWMGSFVTQIAGFTEVDGSMVLTNPVLFLFVVAVPLVGLGIGLLARLIKTRG